MDKIRIPKIKLNNGFEMDTIGLGTWMGAKADFDDDQVSKFVSTALDVGYRHIDTAWMYRTERAIGQTICRKLQEAEVKREDLFITSKLWMTHHSPDDVRENFQDSMNDLGLEYLDLYLMHHPFGLHKPSGVYNPLTYCGQLKINNGSDVVETWKILEEFVKDGHVKSIGVSNFNTNQLQAILDSCDVKPVVNQCEVHLYLQNPDLIRFCQENGVVVTSYSPLGKPPKVIEPEGWSCPLEEILVRDLAAKYCKTPAQIALRYQVQRRLAVVCKTTHSDRMRENLNIFDFELSEEEMEGLQKLDRSMRVFKWPQGIGHKDYPF